MNIMPTHTIQAFQPMALTAVAPVLSGSVLATTQTIEKEKASHELDATMALYLATNDPSLKETLKVRIAILAADGNKTEKSTPVNSIATIGTKTIQATNAPTPVQPVKTATGFNARFANVLKKFPPFSKEWIWHFVTSEIEQYADFAVSMKGFAPRMKYEQDTESKIVNDICKVSYQILTQIAKEARKGKASATCSLDPTCHFWLKRKLSGAQFGIVHKLFLEGCCIQCENTETQLNSANKQLANWVFSWAPSNAFIDWWLNIGENFWNRYSTLVGPNKPISYEYTYSGTLDNVDNAII